MSTPAQRKALEAYIGRIAKIFGLLHWKVEVGDAYKEDDNAGTYIVNNEDSATIHVPERFWTADPEQQRVSVAHELLHLHFDRALLDFYAGVEKILPEWIADGLEVGPTRIQERSIERFAQAVAPNLPLPKLPDGIRVVPSGAMGSTEATNETRASGGKGVRTTLDSLNLGGWLRDHVRFRAAGHKSSEGDGRTAADIRRELERVDGT